MKRAHILTIACLSALTITQASASITLSASDDNYVYSSSSSTNYQFDAPAITVKTANSSSRIGFMKFDLSSVIGSLDTSQDATLNVTFRGVTNASGGDNATFTFEALSNDSPIRADWSETTVTYSSRPAGTFTDLGTDYNWSYNASDVPHSITFSNIANYIQADNTITFRLSGPKLDNTNNNPSFHSSEATTESFRPTLVLATVPEPAAASILLGLSTLAFVGLRRRR
ncbi:DNRLRE domain-containing protein [Coraliomargarita sp. SDUM461003]|uniref:DNRLRE domain-containing protein n=1 Tax=Thalassobacterium maritimum TaxID=3041265 RepID=A0ABU1AT30_9BACT|nr:DNRLRE domain-containing protein [Coraliomargarita sp. SDUM461003]MDQ8207308.1 DNRLRE domain-containing protein [Coraliomargarita sp. SDUM461003]